MIILTIYHMEGQMTEEQCRKELDRLNITRDVHMRALNAGLLPHIRHISYLGSRVCIFVLEGGLEAKRAAFVREFGPDKLAQYYLHDRYLAVGYSHKDADVVYYDADREARLASLSGGKCIITQEAIESVAEQILCAME